MPSFAGGITPSIRPGTATVPAMLASSQLTSAVISSAAGGDIAVVAGVAGKTIRVFRLILVVNAATSITFKDSTPTSFSGAMPIAANGGIVLDFNGDPWYTTAAGKDFVITSSAATQISGTIGYAIS